MIGQTRNGDSKDNEIIIPLKHLSNFWGTIEMTLINCGISLHLKWSKDCILVAGTAANQNPKFDITNAKLYVPVTTSWTQDNIKLFKQLQSTIGHKILPLKNMLNVTPLPRPP